MLGVRPSRVGCRAIRITLVILRLIRDRNPWLTGNGRLGDVQVGRKDDRERMHVLTATKTDHFGGPSGSCDVLLTYQLDGSVTDMLWLQRVQRIRVRSWRVGLRDCSHF